MVAWRALGDLCARALAKGKKVGVSGPLYTRSYTAQDGSKRFITECIAQHIEFLSPKAEAAEQAPQAATGDAPEGGFSEVQDDELPF